MAPIWNKKRKVVAAVVIGVFVFLFVGIGILRNARSVTAIRVVAHPDTREKTDLVLPGFDKKDRAPGLTFSLRPGDGGNRRPQQ